MRAACIDLIRTSNCNINALPPDGCARVSRGCEPQPTAVPDRDRPPAARDCIECGTPEGMTLMNVARTQPTNIPLLYVCKKCGAMLTIPPRVSPLERMDE